VFVLLQIAIVGERQPFHQHQQLLQIGRDTRRFPTYQFQHIRILFMRHDA